VSATTTPAAVREVSGSTLSDSQLQPFVDAAQCLVASVAACAESKGVSQDCLDGAATWLAAHLLSGTSLGADSAVVKSEKFENYSVERIVGGYDGKGVLGTTYGQTANALTGGCLQQIDKAPASIAFFG
jgi:hypothetical protein